jgi:arylamine N-acetyltransferase
MTTEDFVTDYLDFLGVRATDGTTGPPSLAGLNRLFAAHLDRVPYETFDINARRVAPSLCGTAAVNRVLGLADPSARPLTHPLAHPCTSDPTHSHAPMLARGGYCFELVRAFAQLLRRLGYDSRPLMTHPTWTVESTPSSSSCVSRLSCTCLCPPPPTPHVGYPMHATLK